MTEAMAPRPPKIPESVLVVIHTAALEVLLIERADAAGLPTGYWQSVTGSKDTLDEPLELTARREVAEETGIVIGSDQEAAAIPAAIPAAMPTAISTAIPAGAPAAIPATNLRDWHLKNVYPIYPVWLHRYAAGVTHNTESVFGLLVPRDIGITLAPREHVAYAWLPWRDAADRCFSPSNAEAILQLPRFI